MSRRSVKLATWPSAWTPASVRPAPAPSRRGRRAREARPRAVPGRRGRSPAAASRQSGPPSYASVILNGRQLSTVATVGVEPGLHDRQPLARRADRPRARRSAATTSSSATNGTSSSGAAAAIDDRRGADDLAARRSAPPASSRASIRRSSARPRRRARDRSAPSVKPRRSVSAPSCRSAKIARTPSARPTSWPMTTPPSAGDSTTVGRQRAGAFGDGAAERLGVLRMLQHERALQVAGAVEAGGQTEVAFEQRARAPEQIEEFVAGHVFNVERKARHKRTSPLLDSPRAEGVGHGHHEERGRRHRRRARVGVLGGRTDRRRFARAPTTPWRSRGGTPTAWSCASGPATSRRRTSPPRSRATTGFCRSTPTSA